MRPILAPLASLATRAGLVLIAGVIACAGAEGVMRLAYDRIDFLKPEFVADAVLPVLIKPYSAGHDAWGFRNRSRPEQSDVVAIGDSMTYGDAAPASGAWPVWLAEATGRTVYNLGMGGYGPPDYLHILESRALTLHPSLVIVAVYFGNDLSDAFERVYSRDRWRELRRDQRDGSDDPPPNASSAAAAAPPTLPPTQPYTIQYTKDWLEMHSMLYRLIQAGPVGQTINRFVDRSRAIESKSCFLETRSPYPTVLTPFDRLRGLDLSSSKINEGLDITLGIFARMRRAADAAGARLLVLMIPTKESVFVNEVDAAGDSRCVATMLQVVANESIVRNRVMAELDRQGIQHLDALPALRAGVESGKERMYLRSGDSHPNERGYRAIASALIPYVTR